jgi:hypothetical protein
MVINTQLIVHNQPVSIDNTLIAFIVKEACFPDIGVPISCCSNKISSALFIIKIKLKRY